MNAQTELNRDFANVIDRLVTRMFPNAEQQERIDVEGEFAGLAQCIMLQTVHHISGKGTPWEVGK